MKKLFIFLTFLLILFNVKAQTKITKTGIVGKWVPSSVVINHFYTLDLENDNIFFDDSLKIKMVEHHLSEDSAIKMIKPILAIYHNMFYKFNADNTGEIYFGQGPASDYRISYTIDEDASTITTTDRIQKNEPFKAEMIQQRLSCFIHQTPQDGGMDIHIIFNKEK